MHLAYKNDSLACRTSFKVPSLFFIFLYPNGCIYLTLSLKLVVVEDKTHSVFGSVRQA